MRLSIACCLVVWAATVGCGPDVETAPEILLGADPCDYCRMVISEERHAAASVGEQGAARFDDPGCLLAWLDEGERDAVTIWVHDEAKVWRRADDAWFAIDSNHVTPMASGILAFSSEAAARGAVAGPEATVLRFAKLPEGLADRVGVDQSKSRVEK